MLIGPIVKAICCSGEPCHSSPCAAREEMINAADVRDARAVILAVLKEIRDPGDVLIEKGMEVARRQHSYYAGARMGWRAMIDALIAEAETLQQPTV